MSSSTLDLAPGWFPDRCLRAHGDRHMLRLRQAKLSFASTYLVVGVFADDGGDDDSGAPRHPHVERCEALRHVRWVDEVVPDAPRVLDDAFLREKRIDYVALEEGSSVDPEFEKERLRGYDGLRHLGASRPFAFVVGSCFSAGRVIPTRKTVRLLGQPAPALTSRSATPCRSTPEQQEDEEHDADVTHGIHRLTLEGQW